MKFPYEQFDRQGNPKSLSTRKGELTEEGLFLKKLEIPPESFIYASHHAKRVVLVYSEDHDPEKEPEFLILAIHKADPVEFTNLYNRMASTGKAKRERAKLSKEGRLDEYRDHTCPYCDATILLTGYAESPEIHCEYCDGVISPRVAAEDAKAVKVCQNCHLYDQPRKFQTFFFYFFVVFYSFGWQTKFVCNSCAKREARIMLLKNLIFVLGVPYALWQMMRVRRARVVPIESYAGLEEANTAAHRRQIDAAARLYDTVAARNGGSAIASYNKGIALLSAERFEEASSAFEEAILDCSNFSHAATMLVACMLRLERDPKDNPILAEFLRKNESKDQLTQMQ